MIKQHKELIYIIIRKKKYKTIMDILSQIPIITIKDIKDHPYKPWNWGGLSRNPGINLKDILDNPNFSWDWDYVSQNPSITIQDIKDNPETPNDSSNPVVWNWDKLSRNNGIIN